MPCQPTSQKNRHHINGCLGFVKRFWQEKSSQRKIMKEFIKVYINHSFYEIFFKKWKKNYLKSCHFFIFE